MNNSIETETRRLFNEVTTIHGDTRVSLSELMGCSYDSFNAQVEKIKVDKERERLSFVFGEKAKIEKGNNEEWLVELILESRGIVPANQKVNIRLGKEMDLKMEGADCVFCNLYPLEEMKVNDRIIRLSPEIFFSPERTGQKFLNFLTRHQRENKLTDFEYKIFGNGTRDVTISNKYVIMGDFQSAEDLVALLHEVGHTMSKNPNKVGKKDHGLILESVSKLLPGEGLDQTKIEILSEILEEEHKASSQAIDIVKNLRKRGIDLFPKDTDLAQVRLLLSMCLSTFLKGLENYKDLIDFDNQGL